MVNGELKMKAKMMKFAKDWNNGAVIGNSYIIVDINCVALEGANVLEVPRYEMVEAAERAKELNGYVFHIIDAVNNALGK